MVATHPGSRLQSAKPRVTAPASGSTVSNCQTGVLSARDVNPPCSEQPSSFTVRAPLLTVVVPTRNEARNVPILAERLRIALQGLEWEVVFVDDDSPDGTAAIAKTIGDTDARVRCIQRIGRRGLAGACIEGALSSQARFVAVMDGDLQHDETLLRPMLKKLIDAEADVVVGSRFVPGAHADGLSNWRYTTSRVGAALSTWITGVKISDPMSGFFMIERKEFDKIAPTLSTQGFKLLLDILISTRGRLKLHEIPFGFRDRLWGHSKLDLCNLFDFLGLLLHRATNHVVPLRFLGFALVGLSGMAVQLAILGLGLGVGLGFSESVGSGTLAAMTSNFLLNNALTYKDSRLRGAAAVKGLFGFYAVCFVGAVSNIGVASWLYAGHSVWWVAGMAGATVAAVWNYTISSAVVWGRR